MNSETEILGPDVAGLRRAERILSDGGIVAFPTETVYGLGGDARQGRAVAAIFEAKGRPEFNPLIVHVANLSAARAYARFDDTALRLAVSFWPGPLTLVLPLRDDAGLSPLVTAGSNSVALRVPGHALAQSLLQEFAGPIAAPSANISGRISPTEASHVLAGLSGRIDAVLDGGPTEVGLESTIVGLVGRPTLLRPGGLPSEAIEDCLGRGLMAKEDGIISAPGQLASHYAPRVQVRLNATGAKKGERFIGFGPTAGATLNLSEAGDLREAAANLFRHLHALDQETGGIAVAPIPMTGLGRAINDRLKRAAAPRS